MTQTQASGTSETDPAWHFSQMFLEDVLDDESIAGATALALGVDPRDVTVIDGEDAGPAAGLVVVQRYRHDGDFPLQLDIACEPALLTGLDHRAVIEAFAARAETRLLVPDSRGDSPGEAFFLVSGPGDSLPVQIDLAALEADPQVVRLEDPAAGPPWRLEAMLLERNLTDAELAESLAMAFDVLPEDVTILNNRDGVLEPSGPEGRSLVKVERYAFRGEFPWLVRFLDIHRKLDAQHDPRSVFESISVTGETRLLTGGGREGEWWLVDGVLQYELAKVDPEGFEQEPPVVRVWTRARWDAHQAACEASRRALLQRAEAIIAGMGRHVVIRSGPQRLLFEISRVSARSARLPAMVGCFEVTAFSPEAADIRVDVAVEYGWLLPALIPAVLLGFTAWVVAVPDVGIWSLYAFVGVVLAITAVWIWLLPRKSPEKVRAEIMAGLAEPAP